MIATSRTRPAFFRSRLRFVAALTAVAVMPMVPRGAVGVERANAPPDKGAALAAPTATPAGQAMGTFAAKGKTVALTYAVAFTDAGQVGKPLVLVLSDRDLPASSWKDGSDLASYRREHPFLGVAFWINAADTVIRTDFYDGTSFPSGATGIFEVKVVRKGSTLAGSARSMTAAAHLSDPVVLDATFNVTLE